MALHGFGGDADAAFGLGYGDAVAATGMALVSVDGGNGYGMHGATAPTAA